MKEISRGAEAVIFLDKDRIIKQRIKKNYRIDVLDNKLRKTRTRKELNLLKKSSELINVPKVISFSDTEIIMENINGDKLSDIFDKLNEVEIENVFSKIGEFLGKLHNNNIIHNDLTTSNILLCDEKVYFIDFGLGFISTKIEDKAYDLHLLKQALKSRHYHKFEKAFSFVVKGYNSMCKEYKFIEERLSKIELRGRHKRKKSLEKE
jgi:Kae1-associated kinase Bud32